MLIKAVKGDDAEEYPIKTASEPGNYGATLAIQYPSIHLRCRNLGGKVTAGWARAVSAMQAELREKAPSTEVPTLLLHTKSDVVLDGPELGRLAHLVSEDVTTREVKWCRHDMLMNYERAQNEEVPAA